MSIGFPSCMHHYIYKLSKIDSINSKTINIFLGEWMLVQIMLQCVAQVILLKKMQLFI
jgi:hypothetical protein